MKQNTLSPLVCFLVVVGWAFLAGAALIEHGLRKTQLPEVHLSSPVVVIGPGGDLVGETDKIILADTCRELKP